MKLAGSRDVRVVSTGSRFLLLAVFASMPTWLAAQETIPYEQLAPGMIVFPRHGTIHVIDIDTHSRWSRGIGIDPQVSPDGSRIVFYAWHSPSGALNVIGTREGSPLLVNTFGGSMPGPLIFKV